jgi:hypothetical protein
MPDTAEKLEQQLGTSCAQGIGDVPHTGGDVVEVQVWGGNAMVRLGRDTVFLDKAPSGWRVAAAACTPQAEGPYDCEVES